MHKSNKVFNPRFFLFFNTARRINNGFIRLGNSVLEFSDRDITKNYKSYSDLSGSNSLNDKLGSNGIFFDDQKTDQGNTPSDDLAVIKLSSGRAYVRGYQVDKPFTSIVDVEKPRDTEKINSVSIPFTSPNKLTVYAVQGVPKKVSPPT